MQTALLLALATLLAAACALCIVASVAVIAIGEAIYTTARRVARWISTTRRIAR